MTEEQLRRHLDYLVTRYITDEARKASLRMLIRQAGLPPVKAITSEITAAWTRGENGDSDLIKEIAFHFM